MSDQTVKPLDPQFPVSVYQELAGMDVRLDADPLQFGPKRLNGKIALSRKHLSRAGALLLEASRLQAYYKRSLRKAQVVLDLSMDDLLANDPEVRAGRAVSERNAIAKQKLSAEVTAVHECEYAVEELDAVLKIIKAKQSDLKDIQGRIRDQMKICQEEIGLGRKWGSKNPNAAELEPGQGFATAADVEAVEDLVTNMRGATAFMDDDEDDKEVHLPAQVDLSEPDQEAEDKALAGAASVVPADGDEILVEVEVEAPEQPDNLSSLMNGGGQVVTAAEVLPGSDTEAVSDFLDLTMPEPVSGRKAREIADADTLDIEGLLDSL
jgi:hypothetical protein